MHVSTLMNPWTVSAMNTLFMYTVTDVDAVESPVLEHQRIRVDTALASGQDTDQRDLSVAGERLD